MSTSTDDWIPLQSASGRARKRRRRIASIKQVAKREEPIKIVSPQGWRVLWPDPYGEPTTVTESIKGLPGRGDFSRSWATYKSTWAGGLRGDLPVEGEEDMDETDKGKDSTSLDPNELKKNLTKNVSAVQAEAQKLKEEVSERTGIRTQEDLKEFAREMMTLVNDCLKEFMSGYRKGRDQEVERMLNEYFQEFERKREKHEEETAKRKRRRKPKRAILRP